VREFTAPLATEVPRMGNLTDDVVRNASEAPEAAVFSRRSGIEWQDVTATGFKDEVETVAKGLLASGIQPGDRVALISKTRYEWTLLDYAIWWVGAATVPVYDTSAAEQIGWILADSAAVACIVETKEHRARLERIKDGLPELKHLWVIEDGALSELASTGEGVGAGELEERRAGVGAEDLATLVYTSGTTGRPKGCMLTHGNFMFEVGVAVDELEDLFDPDDASTLVFLPLAHVFARIIQVGCVRARARVGHSADMTNLVEDLGQFRPTFVLAVPRVFEKVFNAASQKAHSEGRGRIFDAAATVAMDYSRAMDRGRPIGPLLRLRHAAFDRLVYAKLRAALGGRTEHAVSGGAPLGERLAHFFRGVGVTVLEGYGLTETTGALTVNRSDAIRIGTVGRPLGGTSVRVSDDGELLFRGGQVFSGYWHDERATHEALGDGGWLHTGDVGEVDDDGYVRITGRKKEILVTAGGKNVVPATLEDVVRSHPLVSQCLVVGEARPFVAALITLDPESLPQWRAQHQKRGDVAKLVDDPDLVAEIQRAVDDANATVSRAESIRRFEILPVDWTEESGHMTPTLKLKRNVVVRDFQAAIERLYR
jgi:long-chain acyl-CoA synthetase